MLSLAEGLAAQETSATATAPAATETTAARGTTRTATATSEDGAPAEEGTRPEGEAREASPEATRRPPASEVRNMFANVVRRYPPEVATILTLDPTLLSEPTFLARYPDIGEFVATHPEIRHHPRYYLREFEEQSVPPRPRSMAEELMEAIATVFGIGLVVFGVMFLIRTLVEQRRWSRLSRTQAEVHTKILDRFSTSEELLTYIRTPAGTKFLESAPIPLHAEKPAPNTPLGRSIWSIQIGVVLAAAAVGMLLVSLRLDKESAEDMFAMGMIAFCVGTGFVGSAAVSLLLSRRLGLWQMPQEPESGATNRVDDAGFVK
jgi:uncharacterized membrane protein HdeD (DUF308 family)